jgi:hypothetical protein
VSEIRDGGDELLFTKIAEAKAETKSEETKSALAWEEIHRAGGYRISSVATKAGAIYLYEAAHWDGRKKRKLGKAGTADQAKRLCERDHQKMLDAALKWIEEGPEHFQASTGNRTYYAHRVPYPGNPSYGSKVRVSGPRGGKTEAALGNFKTIEEAKEACEKDARTPANVPYHRVI